MNSYPVYRIAWVKYYIETANNTISFVTTIILTNIWKIFQCWFSIYIILNVYVIIICNYNNFVGLK